MPCYASLVTQKLLIANWKMNPKTAQEAIRLFSTVAQGNYSKTVSVVLCPPFPYLYLVANAARGSVALGSQDLFWESSGPYTGEVSPAILKDASVSYVIVGHSERREWLHEDDAMIAKKVREGLRRGFKVVLCVGEPLSVRLRGIAAAKSFVARQLKENISLLKKTPAKEKESPKEETRVRWENLIVAYEPVWAISTAQEHRDETPEDAADMISFIKKTLSSISRVPLTRLSVLYGGSVDGENVGLFLARHEINGALVGSASLRTGEFKKIIQIAGEQS